MAYKLYRIVARTTLGLAIAAALVLASDRVCAAAPATQPAASSPAAAKPNAQPKPNPIDLKKIASQFDVYPQSINLSSSINFDEHGHPRNKYHQFSISLVVRYPGTVQAQSYSARIDKVLTDAGEVLQIDPNQQRNNSHIYHNSNNHNATETFSIGLNLPMPSRATEKLKEISGKLDVTVAVGPEREVVLEPIKKFDGKRIHVNNFPHSVISVTRQGSHVKVTINKSLAALLDDVHFYDAAGHERRVHGWGGGGSGSGDFYRDYNLKVGDHDKVVLRFFSDTKNIKIPFSIHNVELPMMRGGAPRVDLALNAQLVGQHATAKRGQAGHQHSQPGQLGITIDN